MGYGAASEMGPLLVNGNGTVLEFNKFAWTRGKLLSFLLRSALKLHALIGFVTATSHIGNAASASNTVKPPLPDRCGFEKLHLFSFHPLLPQNVTKFVCYYV